MKRSNVAQMVLQRFPCGCTIEDLGDGSHAINYCPKHKAAPDMYEALRALVGWLEDDKKLIGNVALIQSDCHKALAKAEEVK